MLRCGLDRNLRPRCDAFMIRLFFPVSGSMAEVLYGFSSEAVGFGLVLV